MLDIRSRTQHFHTFSPTVLRFFITCEVIGWVTMTIVVLTALVSQNVRSRRHVTWFNFWFTWILSCLSYLLLSFAGQQTGAQPGHGICITQAALIYAAPPLTATATMMLTLQLWFTMSAMFHKDEKKAHGAHTRRNMIFLVAAPYVVHLVVFIIAIVIGSQTPEAVKRPVSSLYCIVSTGIPGKLSGALVVLAMLVTVSIEVKIGVLLWRNWGSRSFVSNHQFLTMIARVAIFTVFGMLTIAVSLVFLSDVDSVLPNIVIAMIPVSAALIFATQADLFSAFMFWKKKSKKDRTSMSESEAGSEAGAFEGSVRTPNTTWQLVA